MRRKKSIEQDLDQIVRRIVAAARPSKIILFGSAALQAVGPHSDLGLLIVVPDGHHRGETAQKIYSTLMGLKYVADIVVVTESDVEAFKGNVSTLVHPALIDGKLLYDAWQH